MKTGSVANIFRMRAARQVAAINLINAKYGFEPGPQAYTHVSDRFGPSQP